LLDAGFIQIRMHRQTHHPLRHRIAHGQLRFSVGHGGLFVQGDGVVHGGRDAGLFELFLQGFAVGHLDGELGPGAGVVGFDVGGDEGCRKWIPACAGMTFSGAGMRFEEGVIGVGHALALNQFVVQHGQFGQQDGRLQCVQAAVHAHAHMVVAAVLAMARNLAHDFGQFVVVRENCPTIAVTAQRFAGEEAGTRDG
jgi:hypothetical protein